MLVDSTRQKVAFTFSVLQKYIEVEAKYRAAGRFWMIPASLMPAVSRMRNMARRYRKAKRAARGTKDWPRFQHTIEEAQAEAEIGLWVLNQHKALLGLPTVPQLPCDLSWLHSAV